MEEEKRLKLKKELEDLNALSLKKGETWYLIDSRWYKQLKTFLGMDPVTFDGGTDIKALAGSDSAHPGPIDNSTIYQEDKINIREHMIDNLDYQILHEDAWKLLVDNFGLTKGQKPIARKVVEQGMFVKHCKVEVYFLEVQVALSDNQKDIKKCKFSKTDKIAHVSKTLKELFGIPEEQEVRLWNSFSTDNFELLSGLDTTAHDAGIYTNQLLLIERKKSDGTWPEGLSARVKTENGISSTTGTVERPQNTPSTVNGSLTTLSTIETPQPSSSTGNKGVVGPISTRYNYGSYNNDSSTDKVQPGLCGLSNLGNTCFMNSIIQGLSNCPPITDYFANDNYIEDINEDNPLGMKGEIARSFGEMIKSIWSGKYSYFSPRNFKMAVGRFAPQFSGYQQQDSQELMTFLLDGLHEDLNRIKKKPYVEMTDSDNRPDEEVAMEAWQNYKKRNDSVILDLFHGLLKSTVVCPECPKVSVTFDPFCYLSLPLPVKKERRIELFLVYLDPAQCPRQFKVTVAKNGNMRDLCSALSQLSDVDSRKMIVTDVYNHRFHKIYGPDEGVSHILERDDIFVYEVPTTDTSDPHTVIIPVYLREKKTSGAYSPFNLFGNPLLIGVPRDNTTYEVLYSLVLKHLARYVKEDITADWWKAKPLPQSEQNGHVVTTNNSNNAKFSSRDCSEETTPSSDDVPAPQLAVDTANDDFDGGNNQSAPVINNNQDEDMNDDEGNNEEEEEDEGKGPPKMFVMNFVNSYGNAQIEQLANDGKPLKITGLNYLSLDWNKKAKELFYVEKEAENFAQDVSLDSKQAPKKQIRLEECLELYTSKEKLGENDAWYCPKCQKHQQATKKFDIWSLPALLIISLKRFSYNRYWRDKLDAHVEFPINDLDMAPYVINSNHGKAVYDLVACSNHFGGMGGGHYTAYAKNKDDGRWYNFDDSSVYPASESNVVTKAAYVLFYQRRDLAEQMGKDVGHMNIDPGTTLINGGTECNGMNGGDGVAEEAMDIN